MLRELLIQARVESGLSVRELANLIAERRGRSAESVRTTIHRYEADGGPEPRVQTIEDVLDVLGYQLNLIRSPRTKSSRRP
jgi:transposase